MFYTLLRIGIVASFATNAFAQTAAQPQQRVVGVVMEKQGSGAKVRTDTGEIYSIVFFGETKFQKIAPGETSLKGAQNITFTDLADGDRILARGTATDAKTVVAQSIVVMSKSDLAEKQQKERMDWQKRGISGTVVAVNAAKNEISIKPPSLATIQNVTVSLKDKAPLRRYAQDSVRFADAKPAAVADVKVGDQLRARGEKNADGLQFAAEEIVTGTFQTMAGTVLSINAEANELQLKDIDSAKTLTVKLTADSIIKRMGNGPGGPGGPQGGGMMGGGPGGPGGMTGGTPGGGPPAAGPGGAPRGPEGRGAGPAGSGGPGAGPGAGMMGRMPDLAQLMERLPPSNFADIKVGETLIVSSTKGAAADRMTAITVLAGADRLIAMRRAMSMQAGAAAGRGAAAGPGGSWNLGDMSAMPIP
ncbi:MAG: hypothetical protein H7Y20_15095 [Bryobacteraceae bacterium]|nr:hypothetical protein [Bryobacteraceae bacterium]